jgi:ESCRT-II complex subunit VPS36
VSDDSAKPPWLHTVLGPPVTAVDVARALGCGTSVAAEHLALAESRGVLCRDYGPEGLRFFRNFFRDHAGLTAAA